MSHSIAPLSAADFDEAMEVMNLAFGKSPPADFENLLPKLYRADDGLMGCLYALRRGGRILAAVGVHPLTWKVGAATLPIAGISGVSTHPEFRGQGMMQRLMIHCVGVMKEEGYPLSVLGGQRQRYGYFGYERCGVEVELRLNKSNIRHCFSTPSNIRFEPLDDGPAGRLEAARGLHDAQPVRVERSPRDFHAVLRSWRAVPYAALQEGELAGYVAVNLEGDELLEVVGRDGDTAFEIARAWVEQGDAESVTIRVEPLAGRLLHRLGEVCEASALRGSGNWQVFDWPRVISALLAAKAAAAPSGAPLADGRVTLGIGGYGAVAITVAAGEVSCERVEETPAISCDPHLAHRLLFGPLAPSQSLPLPKEAAALESWCPLPLFWSKPDAV